MSGSGGSGMPRDVSFAQLVMDRVTHERRPSASRAFLAAARAGSARDALAALGTAWHLFTVRQWVIAPRVRLRAAALVLSVVGALTLGASLAAAAAIHVIEQANEQGATQNSQNGMDEQHDQQSQKDDSRGQAADQADVRAGNGEDGTGVNGPDHEQQSGVNEDGAHGSADGADGGGKTNADDGTEGNGDSGGTRSRAQNQHDGAGAGDASLGNGDQSDSGRQGGG
jgi:hypothetical protein